MYIGEMHVILVTNIDDDMLLKLPFPSLTSTNMER